MDVITTAIIAALATLTKDVINDSYKALKSALKEKFGSDSNIVKSVEELENQPDSKGRQIVLQEEIENAKANDDATITQLAEALLHQLQEQPEGKQIIQQNISNVKYAATSGTGTAIIKNIKEDSVSEN